MATATRDIDTHERLDYQFGKRAAGNVEIFKGIILGKLTSGNEILGRPWVALDAVLGVSSEYVNNLGGAAGAKTVQYKLGCFKFKQNGTINQTHIGQYAKPVDDNTVALDGAVTSATTAGRIVEVDTDGVWVEFRRYVG